MYLRILKKDMKRKKAMNVILLMFVILAAMFASSSVNNILTVVNGLDYFFEKADMSDHFIINIERNGEDNITAVLESKSAVKDFRREQQIRSDSKQITRNGNMIAEFSNACLILSIDNAQINYFNKDNEVIRSVKERNAYFTGVLVNKHDLALGDEFSIAAGDTEITLKYAGIAKDAFLGSDMMGNPRILVNNADYEKLASDPKVRANNMSSLFYVNGYDKKELESELSGLQNVNFNQSIDTIKMTYIVNTFVAGLLLVVGICLLLISFVVLRFTIRFTLNEEFREIGVMKAIGLKSRSVRGLYLIKYLGISLIGAVIGFILSIPFGNMLLSSVSENIVLGSDHSILTGILCSIAVVLITLLFCWSCTRKIKKLSPVDAVRSGQNGERFRRKSIMELGRSRLGATGFLALNDILSSPKQFTVITLIFTLCLLLIMIPANTANTIASEKLLPLMCSVKSDAYITDSGMISRIMGGECTYTELCSEIEQKLDENGMPCRAYGEAMLYTAVEHGDKKAAANFMYCKDTKASQYIYTEGYAPKYANEIAVTKILANKLGAGIGDRINVTIGDKAEEFIITAFFNSMVQLGEVGRFHESADIPDELVHQVMSFQVNFDDSPDAKTAEQRIEKLKDIFGSDYIYNADGFVMACIGSGIKDTVSSAKYLIITIALIIIIMISVLIERSFISKEKSEIALMKAVGFKSDSIIAQHTLRFVIVAFLASILSIVLCLPLTKLVINPVFGIMGAANGVDYNIRPIEVCVVYPIMIIAATVLGAFLTALYMKTIKASDTSDIE